ncbi:hypothetical protein [Clostridium brassicae]|uniref:Uncharacterized protein n=1 Tax=Clostridium brassicae TaxID=2999072 RepID=A0ABT4D8H8_9CLOT|nr:hypothetical protein [Clostridium brassicae]MCY6958612.1 hypothetical protein [Clostridium brassicae]
MKNKVELEDKQRVHRVFPATSKGRTSEEEYIRNQQNEDKILQKILYIMP